MDEEAEKFFKSHGLICKLAVNCIKHRFRRFTTSIAVLQAQNIKSISWKILILNPGLLFTNCRYRKVKFGFQDVVFTLFILKKTKRKKTNVLF